MENGNCKCPQGQTLKGDKCEKINKCPPGFQQQNGKCLPEKPKCKDGEILSKGKCIKKLQCPNGQHLENGKCVVNKQIKCLKGQILEGGKCVTRAGPSNILKCPPNQVRVGKTCKPINKTSGKTSRQTSRQTSRITTRRTIRFTTRRKCFGKRCF